MEAQATPRRARRHRAKVPEAAVALADEVGIETLRMRRVAEELGVAPMALYKHVADKEDLLDGMVEGGASPRNSSISRANEVRKHQSNLPRRCVRRCSPRWAGLTPNIASIATSTPHDDQTVFGHGCDDEFEFRFALDLMLDGIERLPAALELGASEGGTLLMKDRIALGRARQWRSR